VAAFEARGKLVSQPKVVEETPNKISVTMPESTEFQLTPKQNPISRSSMKPPGRLKIELCNDSGH
jgi:hypothetical protein